MAVFRCRISRLAGSKGDIVESKWREYSSRVCIYIYIYTCENNLWPVSKAYKEITKERKIFVNTENVFVFERSTSRRRLEERGVKFPGGWNFEGRKELRMESRQIPF